MNDRDQSDEAGRMSPAELKFHALHLASLLPTNPADARAVIGAVEDLLDWRAGAPSDAAKLN